MLIKYEKGGYDNAIIDGDVEALPSSDGVHAYVRDQYGNVLAHTSDFSDVKGDAKNHLRRAKVLAAAINREFHRGTRCVRIAWCFRIFHTKL